MTIVDKLMDTFRSNFEKQQRALLLVSFASKDKRKIKDCVEKSLDYQVAAQKVFRLYENYKEHYKHTERIDAFDSIMSAIYGVGPLPVGLDKEKFRIKRLIQESKRK